MATVPELLRPVESAQAAPLSPLADQIRQVQDRQRIDFVSSMETAAKVNPDEFAQATQLERITGVPADVLSKHSAQVRQLLQGNKYAGVYERYRKTAQALSDGRTAALAQDDIDNLIRIERAQLETKFSEQSSGEQLLNSLKSSWVQDGVSSGVANADRLGRIRQQFDNVDAELSRATTAGEEPFPAGDEALNPFGREYLLATPEARQEMRQNLLGAQTDSLSRIAKGQARLEEFPADPGALRMQELGSDLPGTAEALAENPGFVVRTSLGALASSAEMLVAGALTGPLGAGVVGFSGEYNAKLADVLREAKVDLNDPDAVLTALQNDELMDDARARASRKAAGTTAVDMLSMSLAGRLLAPTRVGGRELSRTQRELANLAVQFPVQGATEGLGEAVGQYAADGEVNGGEVLLEALAGAGMSSIDVLTFSSERLLGSLQDGLAKSRQAKQVKAALAEMGDAALSSKLRERDPQTFRAVAELQLKDTEMETVWIPADKLAQLDQSGMVDLPALLKAVPGLAEQLDDAAARGGSVQVKTADYLTYLAGHPEILGDSVRLQVDGMSIEDAAAWQESKVAEITALAESMSAQADPLRVATNALMGELQQAGYSRQDAEQYAATHLSVLSNLALRTGRTLEEVQQQFPLSIRNEAPESLQRIPVDDARLAIQRLRDGDIPTSSDMFGKTLGEYLRDAGGLSDAGGELAALDADVGKVGRNRITREGGMSLDDAAMQAWERGYFPGVRREEVGPQLIIDSIQSELAGQPVYSSEQENATLRDQAINLEQLQAHIEQLGIDLATTTDDQVLALMRSPEPIRGERLNQSRIDAEVLAPPIRKARSFTDARAAAKEFQGKKLENSATGITASVSRNSLDKMLSASAARKSTTPAEHSLAVANLDQLFDRAVLGWTKQDRAGDPNVTAVHRMFAPMRTDDGVRLVKLTVKELGLDADGNRIYSVETLDVEKVGPVPDMVAADIGSSDLISTGLTGPLESLVEDISRLNKLMGDGDSRLEQGDQGGGPRGFISFSPKGKGPRKFQISLTGKRDLSTLLHELGHFYLEVIDDIASGPDAPEQIVKDAATIRQWVGAEAGQPLTTEQHEQFARGFESYLAEGKAPSPELQGAFSRFKRWLLAIYKDLSRLNVELTDDIRGVFDRLVASDEQIEAAEQISQALPLFADAQSAGMTDAEYTAYREQLALSADDARTSVEQQIIREEQRRRSKWWSEELGKIRREVAEEVDIQPEYQVQRALRKGVMPDGQPVDLKLQSSEIKERYGTKVLRRLSFMHAKHGGVPMDVVASMFGYGSGDEMVKAILSAPSRAEAIDVESQVRMRERHGLKEDGEAVEVAMAAVHNERRSAVLLKELSALAKQGNRKILTSQQILKAAAERIMSGRKVRDIQPIEYQRAEAKAGRQAFDAAARGDLDGAYQFKQQQLLNFHLYRQAVRARESVDAITDRMKGYNKASKRERIAKSGRGYIDQIDAIMEQYEFRSVSLRQLDRRQSMLEWYQEQLAAGTEPYVPEFVLNTARRVNYKDLSLAELQELDEFTAHIEHLAKRWNELLSNRRIRDFDDAKNQLVAAARANNSKKKAPPVDAGTLSLIERLGDKVSHLNSSLLKMEQIVEWLDGGDIDGPWSQIFWQPFVEAQAQKDDLNRQFTIRLTQLVDGYIRDRGKDAMEQLVHIGSIGQPLTRNAIISVALNTGNASNRKKLLDGRGWDEQQLAEILSHMAEQDWRFTQSLWDLVEELWPRIEQLERDLHGLPPDKVEPLTVSTSVGEFRGGYWPLVYDTSSPAYAQVANNLKDSTGLFEEGYARATTPKGHTKARVDSFAAPILLDVGVVANHLGMVIHDLTHRRAIRDAAKIIGNAEIKQTLNETLGIRVADQFNPWLQGVANDMVLDSRKGIDSWLSLSARLRANLTVAWMGFSATTGIQQILGYSQTFEYFTQKGGKRFILQGMSEFIRHPMETIEMVRSLSGEMRNREGNLDQNMREVLRKISGKGGGLNALQRIAFRHIGLIQSMVDYPTWLAGYHQAMDAGENLDVAIQAGDRAVRLSQMAAGPKDLAAVQRKDGLMRALTLTYSYFSLLWNRQVDLVRSLQAAEGVADYMNVMMRALFLIAIPAVAGPLLTGDAPDDDETWSKWAALKVLTYPMMGVPLLRDFASAWESGWGYRGATPIGSLFETLNRVSGAFTAKEPNAERITLSLIDALGYGVGLPSAQPKRTLRYLWDLAEGERPDDDVIDFVRGVLFGPPKDG